MGVLGQFGAPANPHPEWKPHPIQGWTPNFIPKVCEEGVKATGLKKEDIVLVDGKDAMETAKNAPKGSNLLAMVPDTAERYMSTPLFASIEAEMNAEEQELFDYTPLGKA